MIDIKIKRNANDKGGLHFTSNLKRDFTPSNLIAIRSRDFQNKKMFCTRTFRCIRKIDVIPPYSRLKRPNASIKRAKYMCQKSPLHFVTCGLKHFQLKANL